MEDIFAAVDMLGFVEDRFEAVVGVGVCVAELPTKGIGVGVEVGFESDCD